MAKLQELGFLGADLLHTVDGRSYLTRAQLTEDVSAAVAASGGRAALADLPALLNADLIHCEAAAGDAVAASQGELSLVGGDIVSRAYFSSVVSELSALLSASGGALPLAAACSRFQLGADILTRVLEPAIADERIDASLEGGVLTTAAAARRAKAALRGALRAATAPVPLAPLAKKLSLEGKAGTPAGLAALVEELISEHSVAGTLRAGGASFAPALASAAAAAATAAFYAQNGYIEYAALARAGGGAGSAAGLADARTRAATTFPDGTPLATVHAAPSLLTAADVAAEEGAATGWVDVSAALPPALTREDAVAAVAASPCVARLAKAGDGPGGGAVLAGTCVVTTAFVEGVRGRAVDAARRAAEAALAAKPGAPSAPGDGADAAKPKPKPVAADSDDDGDWGAKKGGGKKKKKGGVGGGSGGGAKKPAPKAAPPPARATGATCIALSLDALEAAIDNEWAPGTGDAGASDDGGTLASALAAAVRPAAIAEYDRVIADAASAGADARRRARDALVAVAVAASDRLQLYARGAEAIAAPADDGATTDAADAIARHLVRGPGAEAGDALLRVMAADADAGGAPPPPPTAASLTPAARTALVAKLPSDVRPAAEALAAALAGGDVASLMDALETAAPAAGARVRRLDKKAEKALVADARRSLEASLEAEADPAAALPLAACAALARAAGRASSVPGRALGALVASLERNGVPTDEAALFGRYHGDVVALLKARSAGDDAAAAAASARLGDALPKLKAAAVGGGGSGE